VTRKSLALLARHQTGALVATVADFVMMIAWVELRLGSSVSGAAVGAASGALTNFIIGRQWTFQASHRSAAGQAFRYAMVSAGSLGLNSLGQYLALRVSALPYVLCRVMVAFLVGVCWNFPLQRLFVFPGGLRDSRSGQRATS
jgi:putative flippase GtrA